MLDYIKDFIQYIKEMQAFFAKEDKKTAQRGAEILAECAREENDECGSRAKIFFELA